MNRTPDIQTTGAPGASESERQLGAVNGCIFQVELPPASDRECSGVGGVRNLREAPICSVAVAKLRAEGWKVACEIPISYRNVDAAASREGKTLILEAKIGLTKGLRYQLQSALMGGDFVVGAIGAKPRPESLAWCEKFGVGVWLVLNGTVTELLAPKPQNPWSHYREQVLARIERWNDATVGGVPNMKGVGAAQETQRAVDEYRAANPKATWKEIFAAVPSHYDSAKNMYSALRSNQERLAIRARLKARRIQDSERAAGVRSILENIRRQKRKITRAMSYALAETSTNTNNSMENQDSQQHEGGALAPCPGSETPPELQPRMNEGVPGGGEWEAHGTYQEIQMRNGCITLEPRPSYCDRGNWIAKVFAEREVSIDEQDGWPRYYFDEARAKAEIEAWMRKRGQWLEGGGETGVNTKRKSPNH